MKFLILFVALFGTGLAFLFGGGPEEGECGCCPHPCCCVCIDQEQTTPMTTTSTTTTSTTTTTTSTTTTSTPFIPICNATQELAIIVDASGSIGTAYWKVAKQFIKDLISAFDIIGDEGTRVGFITFSTNATVWWRLDSKQTSSRSRLLKAIDAIPLAGEFTNTPEALMFANNDIFNAPGDKPEVPNVAIVLTDGRHTHGGNIFQEVAADLQDTATVIAIGVTTQISYDDLETIASGKGRENTFRVTDYEALKGILTDLVMITCTEPPIRPSTTPRPTRPPRTPRPTTTRAPTTPRPTLPPLRECFCCCPPPSFGGIRPLNLCC